MARIHTQGADHKSYEIWNSTASDTMSMHSLLKSEPQANHVKNGADIVVAFVYENSACQRTYRFRGEETGTRTKSSVSNRCTSDTVDSYLGKLMPVLGGLKAIDSYICISISEVKEFARESVVFPKMGISDGSCDGIQCVILFAAGYAP